jgi:hypothetical protein
MLPSADHLLGSRPGLGAFTSYCDDLLVSLLLWFEESRFDALLLKLPPVHLVGGVLSGAVRPRRELSLAHTPERLPQAREPVSRGPSRSRFPTPRMHPTLQVEASKIPP